MEAPLPYYESFALNLIAEGDERAFWPFYSFHANLLRPFLLHNTRSETDVEDIIQETFIRVWLHRDQLPAIDNVKGWIYTIASRVYLDHLEREIKRRQRKEVFGEALYGQGHVHPEELTHFREINRSIQKALDALPEQKKKVFRLNREMNMKPAQIAGHLNIPVGTVKNQLSAALREIREQLAADGFGPLTIISVLSLPGYLFF